MGAIFRDFVKPVIRFKDLGNGSYSPIGATGTGFTFGEGTFITCGHCVTQGLPEDEVYGVPIELNGIPASGVAVLANISRDENGADLAVANVGISSNRGFHLADEPALWGEEVVSFCYPLTENTVNPKTGEPLIKTQARVFRGYVISVIDGDMHDRRPTRVYELDMPAPKWSSGSPVFRLNPFELVGVVQGQRSSAVGDDDFGFEYSLAHHLEVLSNIRGDATGGKSLAEVLRVHANQGS